MSSRSYKLIAVKNFDTYRISKEKIEGLRSLPFILNKMQRLAIKLEDFSAFKPTDSLWTGLTRGFQFWRPEIRRATLHSFRQHCHFSPRYKTARIVSIFPYLTTLRHLSLTIKKNRCPPVRVKDPDTSHLFGALWTQLGQKIETLVLCSPLGLYPSILDNAQNLPCLKSLGLGVDHSASTDDIINVLNIAVHCLATFVNAQATHLETLSVTLLLKDRDIRPTRSPVDFSPIFNLNQLPALRSFKTNLSNPAKSHLGPALESFIWRHSLNLRHISLDVTRLPSRIKGDIMAFSNLEIIHVKLRQKKAPICLDFIKLLFRRASSTLKDTCILHFPLEGDQFSSVLETLSHCPKLRRFHFTMNVPAVDVTVFDQLAASLLNLRHLSIHLHSRGGSDEPIPFEYNNDYSSLLQDLKYRYYGDWPLESFIVIKYNVVFTLPDEVRKRLQRSIPSLRYFTKDVDSPNLNIYPIKEDSGCKVLL